MDTVICGMQQFGIGVDDVVKAYNWYIKAFGVDIKITDAYGVAERMLPYTGGKPRPRRAIIAVNLQGGGGLEIWEPKDNNITFPSTAPMLGDLGIVCGKIKCKDAQKAWDHLKTVEGAELLGSVCDAPVGGKHFYMKDFYGNLFEVCEDSYIFVDNGCPTGGGHGTVMGVTDMDRSIEFYSRLVGFDKVLFDKTDKFEDFAALPGGDGRFRRVILTRSEAFEGPLSEVYGTCYIELVQALDRTPSKIFEGRWWGDPGFIQICFDVRNMEGIHERVKALGSDFVCDSGNDFQMGDTDGHFTYVEDPDGTLIEFVEAYRITVVKKLGLAINLMGRDPHKALPRFLTKAVKFLRVKSIK